MGRRKAGQARGEVGRAVKALAAAGDGVQAALAELGRFFSFLGLTLYWGVRGPYEGGEWLRQMQRVGVASLPVVVLTGAFTGMVLTLQIFQGFARFGAEAYVGAVVSLSILREVGPMLTALMVTGRAGSSIAAELGNMRASEQIDALVAMSTEPVHYLFVPRVVAGVTMLPLLLVVFDAVALGGGRLVAVQLLGTNPDEYDHSTWRNLDLVDLFSGLIKAAVFGLLFTEVACVQGYSASGGAEGVGRASTRAVVGASVAIVVTDFFLSRLIF